MSEYDNLTCSLLGKLIWTEISPIRSYRAFLMLLPVHSSSAYQTRTSLLQRRLFGKGFSIAADLVFEVETRPGSFFGSEYTWKGKHMGEILFSGFGRRFKFNSRI